MQWSTPINVAYESVVPFWYTLCQKKINASYAASAHACAVVFLSVCVSVTALSV